ncbi:MAG: hypothetical protein ACFCU6_00025 [Balneolaceae bacterium]
MIKHSFYSIFYLTLLFFIDVNVSEAQPAANNLAAEIEKANLERISQIEQITIVSEMVEGGFGEQESSNTYVKIVRDGKPVLTVKDDEEEIMGQVTGLHDEIMVNMVANSSSIQSDLLDGRNCYLIEVDDAEFLQSLMEFDSFFDEEDEMETQHESVKIWLDTEELLPYKVKFQSRMAEGNLVTMNIQMSDYQFYKGFPVAHNTIFEIEGMDAMISPEDFEEARQNLEELDKQLESMPEAQREMIMRQMQPQIDRMRAMVEQGGIGVVNMHIRVKDVIVQ